MAYILWSVRQATMDHVLDIYIRLRPLFAVSFDDQVVRGEVRRGVRRDLNFSRALQGCELVNWLLDSFMRGFVLE